jgi:hypothetical protein
LNARDQCFSWQEHYKRAQFAEFMKNTPIIYTPAEFEAMLERTIGERPAGCARPPDQLSEEDARQFHAEFEARREVDEG